MMKNNGMITIVARKIMSAILLAAITMFVNAEESTWFDAQIETYTVWPTNNIPLFRGEWRNAENATLEANGLRLSGDLLFAAAETKSTDEGGVVVNSVWSDISPMDFVPTEVSAETDLKAFVCAVIDAVRGTNIYHVLEFDESIGSNICVNTGIACVPDEKISIFIDKAVSKGEGFLTNIYIFGEESEGRRYSSVVYVDPAKNAVSEIQLSGSGKLSSLSGMSTGASTPIYTVSFVVQHGQRIGGGQLEQAVLHEMPAMAPEIEGNRGWIFKGWDLDFSSVTNNMTVTALWEKLSEYRGVVGGGNVDFDSVEWAAGMPYPDADKTYSKLLLNVSADAVLTVRERLSIGTLVLAGSGNLTIRMVGAGAFYPGCIDTTGYSGTLKFAVGDGATVEYYLGESSDRSQPAEGGDYLPFIAYETEVEGGGTVEFSYSVTGVCNIEGLDFSKLTGNGFVSINNAYIGDANYICVPAVKFADTLSLHSNADIMLPGVYSKESPFTVHNLAGGGRFRCDWDDVGSTRGLATIQTTNTLFTGCILGTGAGSGGMSREAEFFVESENLSPDYENFRLVIGDSPENSTVEVASGRLDTAATIVVATNGALEINRTWNGSARICGIVGGCGGFASNVVFASGAEYILSKNHPLTIGGGVTFGNAFAVHTEEDPVNLLVMSVDDAATVVGVSDTELDLHVRGVRSELFRLQRRSGGIYVATKEGVKTVRFDPGAHGRFTGGGAPLQFIPENGKIDPPVVRGNDGWVFVGWNVNLDQIEDGTVATAQYRTLKADLHVDALSVPDSAMTGGRITINWTIGNTGNPNWNDRTVEQIRLVDVNDSSHTFVIADLACNLEVARDGGQVVRSHEWNIPAKGFAGEWRVVVETAIGNANEYGGDNTRISDNTIVVTQCPLPDLSVKSIGLDRNPAEYMPLDTVTVRYVVQNTGTGVANAPWRDRLYLCKNGTRVTLATLNETEDIAAGEEVERTIRCAIPELIALSGDVSFVVKADCDDSIVELADDDAAEDVAWVETPNATLGKRIYLSFNSSSVYENSGSVRFYARRSGETDKALVLSLSASGAISDVTFPAEITIGAGSSTASGYAYPIDNNVVEGTRTVVFTLTPPVDAGFEAVTSVLTIIDNEVPKLTMSFDKTSIKEGDGVILVTLTRELVTDEPLTVYLNGVSTSHCSYPSSVVIPAGAASVTFEIDPVNNDAAEIAAALTLRASANGYTATTQSFTVEDDDVPSVTLAIYPEEVSEGAGPNAAYAVLSRVNEDNIGSAITVNLTPSLANQLIMQSSVTIPAYTMAVRFPIGTVDNGDDEGDRDITITGSIYIPSCGCSGQPSSGDVIEAAIRIIDNDTPALSLRADPSTMKEGLDYAGDLILSHNSVLMEDLVVTLSFDTAGEIEIPASVVIPAGETSVTIPVKTLDDGVTDGGKLISVYADDESGEFKSASTWIQVSDQNLPDLKVTGITLPASVHAGRQFEIEFETANIGFVNAPNEIEYAIHLVGGGRGSSATSSNKIGAGKITGGLAVNDSISTSFTITAPSDTGDYRVVVVIDPDGKISELDDANNTLTSSAIAVSAAYTATVTVAEKVYQSGDEIVFNGSAVMPDGTTPAANRPIDLYVLVNGMRRTYNLTTDASGLFGMVFNPSSGEAGDYSVGACYPGVNSKVAQDFFSIIGMKRSSTANVIWDIALGDSATRTVTIQNRSAVPLTGLTVTFTDVPEECGFTYSLPDTIPANGSVTLSMTATADGLTDQVDYRKFYAHLAVDEGLVLDFPLYFHSQAQRAYLRATPTSINTTMAIGQTRYIEATLVNDGKGDSGAVSVSVPDVNWLKIVSGASIDNLASGESATITLAISPTAEDGLTLNSPLSGGRMAVNCANGTGCSVSLKFTPVSEATGSITVDAVDNNTYTIESAPHLSNATVRVSNPYTGVTVATGKTDENGIWSADDIPEGLYQLTITAPNHETYADGITIEPERNKRVDAFLQYQLVSVSWNVEKTEIEDAYDIDLVLDFETQVPAPIVKTYMPNELPVLNEGEAYTFTVTLENTGLISAEKVTLTMPNIEGYTFVLSDNDIVLPAKSSAIITVLFNRPKTRSLSLMASGAGTTTIRTEKIRHNARTGVDYACGPQHPHYEYVTQFYHGERTVTSSSYVSGDTWVSYGNGGSSDPSRSNGGGSIGTGGFGSGATSTYTKKGCDACLNNIKEQLEDCGVRYERAQGIEELFIQFELDGYILPSWISSVPWFKDGNAFLSLAKDKQDDILKYSTLAKIAYEDDDPDGWLAPSGYLRMTTDELATIFGVRENGIAFTIVKDGVIAGSGGFAATILRDSSTGSLAIAFRGTEFSVATINDIGTDAANKLCFYTDQYRCAAETLRRALVVTKNNNGISGKWITAVGHSLGGGLVQFAMASNDLDNRVYGYTYNSAGLCEEYYNISKSNLSNLSITDHILDSELGKAASEVIVNVRNIGDPVSFWGKHIGPIYDVMNEVEDKSSHSIDSLIYNLYNSTRNKASDWSMRKEALIKFLNITLDVSLTAEEMKCIRHLCTACGNEISDEDIESRIEMSSNGYIVTSDYNTNNDDLNDALRNVEVFVQASETVKHYFMEVEGPLYGIQIDKATFDAFWTKFIELAKKGEIVSIDEARMYYPDDCDKNVFDQFITRWNNTIELLKSEFETNNGAMNLEHMNDLIRSMSSQDAYMTSSEDKYPATSLRSRSNNTTEISIYHPLSGDTSISGFFTNAIKTLKEIVDSNSSAVCASVTLKLSQTLAMTREAFDGTLTLYNGNTMTPITDLKLDVSVLDEDGNECKDLFEIFANGTSGDMSDGSALAGGLAVSANGTGSAMIRFIPERSAAPTEEKLYRFGGTVTYTDPFSGETATVKLTPVSLTVSPSPYLHLDYFVQRDVFADDPFTPDVVEASMPAELAVLVRNVGGGDANRVTIASAQPEMVKNEKGLSVAFNLRDYTLDASALNGATAHLGLNTVSLGTIEPNESKVAQWWLTSTLEGHFVGMSATVTPVNSWNTPDTTLVDTNAPVHKLVRSVVADGDTLPDFLVCDGSDLYGTPNEIYTANGDDPLPVYVATVATSATLPAGGEIELPLSLTPARSGWNYGYATIPGIFRYAISRIVRGDGTEISLRNVWITDRTFRDGNTPLLEDRLHIVDEFTSENAQTYTVYLAAKPSDVPEVVAFEGVMDGAIEYAARNAVTVVFSKPIYSDMFTVDDLQLMKQGAYLSDLSSITITPADDSGTRFTIGNLSALCSEYDRYELIVQCAGIADTVGQLGISGKAVAWTFSAPDSPYILDAEGRPTRRVRRMDGVTTVTSMPVTEESAQNLVVTLNETDVSQFVTIHASDDTGTRFTIDGLDDLQLNDGDYTLVIDCGNLVGVYGGNGIGSYRFSWTKDTTAPVVNGISRETGLNGTSFVLDMTEDADPATISLDNVMLTRKTSQQMNLASGLLGAAPVGETEIALPATARLTAHGNGSYSVSGIDSVILEDGTYTLYFDAAGVTDEAGNEASGVKSVTWTVDKTAPDGVVDIAVSSEYGSVDTCVYTVTRALTISGTIPESGLTVEVFANSVGSEETRLAVPEVDGNLRFTADVTLPGDGNMTVIIRLTDGYGNSSDTEFAVYVDAIALVAEISGMPEPDEAADTLTITFLNGTPDEATVLAATMSLTLDDEVVEIPNLTIAKTEDARVYMVSGLAEYTAAYGTYVFTYDVRDVRKAISGMTGDAVATATWVNYQTDTTAPTIADIRFDGVAPEAAYVTDQMFSEVSVRFSEAVNVPDLLEQGVAKQAFSIQILSEDNMVVETLFADNLAWDAETSTARWTVDSAAIPCGKARLVIDASLLKDASGNGLVATEAYDVVSGAKTYTPGLLKRGVAHSYACPTLYDWNNDGLLDLIVGEKTEDSKGKVRIYLNRGTAYQPEFDDYTYLQKNGEDVEFIAQGCVGIQVGFGHLRRATMVLSSSQGEIYGWRHRFRNPKTKESVEWDSWFDHATDPRFSSLIRTQIFCCDIDNDGYDEVIVSGQNSPMFWLKRTLLENGEYATECTPLMDVNGANLKFPEGQNHTAAIMTDVSGDSVLDLVTGDTAGNVWVYYGTGNARFAATPALIYENTEISNKRSRLAVGDVNGDGVEDILVGRQDGSVLLLRGNAMLTPAVNFRRVEIKSVEEALNDHIYWENGADGWTCEQFGDEAQATVSHSSEAQTTVLTAKFTGAGTVTFTWAVSGTGELSEFRCTGGDSEIVKKGPFSQVAQSVVLSAPGEHMVSWTFTGRNTAIVRDVAFTPADESLQVTQTTDVPIPFADINRFANDVWKACGGDYEAAAHAVAANGRIVMDNCIAGIDSSDPNAVFSAKIKVVDGVAKISWIPALNGEVDNEGVPTGIRTYTVYGTDDIQSGEWIVVTPENKAGLRFFKVTVEMP